MSRSGKFSKATKSSGVGGESSPEHDHSFSCKANVRTANLSRFAARDLTLIVHYNEPHPAIEAARVGTFEGTYEDLFSIDPTFQARLGGTRYRDVLQVQIRRGELYGGPL